METKHTFSFGYSSCPNDTFIFKAIANRLIDLGPYAFDISLEDVETLNQKASSGIYAVTKLSFAAFGNLMENYGLLRSGSALGKGCGPLVISLPGRTLSDRKKPVIAVPGIGTTAFHLFQFYIQDQFEGHDMDFLPMPFENIMPAVIQKKADFGVIIHEGRFIYKSMGLEMKADLGQWWENDTNLPIPLGCIAIKRTIDSQTSHDIETLIRNSILHAFEHPGILFDYIKAHARELNNDVIKQHIDLYVNEYSVDLGEIGARSIRAFLDKAASHGLIPLASQPLFAC